MQFPDRSDSIDFYTDLVRRARASGDIAAARNAYTALVESWKQQNANSGGALQNELDTIRREIQRILKSLFGNLGKYSIEFRLENIGP